MSPDGDVSSHKTELAGPAFEASAIFLLIPKVETQEVYGTYRTSCTQVALVEHWISPID